MHSAGKRFGQHGAAHHKWLQAVFEVRIASQKGFDAGVLNSRERTVSEGHQLFVRYVFHRAAPQGPLLFSSQADHLLRLQ